MERLNRRKRGVSHCRKGYRRVSQKRHGEYYNIILMYELS